MISAWVGKATANKREPLCVRRHSANVENFVGNRKAAKQLFFSYAYRMSRKALVDAAVSLGVERPQAMEAFRLFRRYEDWKQEVWAEFQSFGGVAAVLGNHYCQACGGQLTGKEQRSANSQVVQGTASLIFKCALIAASYIGVMRVLLPMHDTLFFEHKITETPDTVVITVESITKEVLYGGVAGKASISDFAESEQKSFVPHENEV